VSLDYRRRSDRYRLRVYGHEFLAQKSLVQLSLGHPFVRSQHKPPSVKLYSRTSQESLHLWSSLKLVLASKSDTSSVPHSVILPLADEREVFTFQLSSLENFTLELSLYPTFGSRVIGRAVILPSVFLDVDYHKGLVAPLLDHQLKAIGEVAFEVSCIRPFIGAQLEIGGRVETYWKSKVTPSAPTQDHARTRPLSVSLSTMSRPTASVTAGSSTQESALVTASSLSGEYVHVIVQVTKDGVPVAYPEWRLPIPGLDIGVADVTLAQFLDIAQKTNSSFSPPGSTTATDVYKSISTSLVPLETLLATLPSEVGLNVQPRYARINDAAHELVGRSGEVNRFVDEILRVVYDAGRKGAGEAGAGTGGGGVGRKIIFSSFDPTVCTALNWKQPNCECLMSPPHTVLGSS
jgi:CDK inhibitor PHO81